MSYTPKSTLYNWFKTNKKPTQEQFWAWMDSYWHKSELIPLNQIENLDAVLEQNVLQADSKYMGKITSAVTFVESESTEPSQISFKAGKYYGTDLRGQKKTFLQTGDVVETQTTIRNPTVTTDSFTVFYTGENGIEQRGVADLTLFKNSVINAANAGYKGDLKKTYPVPTAAGMYRLLELGDYPNLTPAVDELGASVVIKAVSSKINQAYFDGSFWTYKGIEIPQPIQSIPKFEDLIFPAPSRVQAIYNDTYWIVKEGRIATASDIPFLESTKWDYLGDKKIFDVTKTENDDVTDYKTFVLAAGQANANGSITTSLNWINATITSGYSAGDILTIRGFGNDTTIVNGGIPRILFYKGSPSAANLISIINHNSTVEQSFVIPALTQVIYVNISAGTNIGVDPANSPYKNSFKIFKVINGDEVTFLNVEKIKTEDRIETNQLNTIESSINMLEKTIAPIIIRDKNAYSVSLTSGAINKTTGGTVAVSGCTRTTVSNSAVMIAYNGQDLGYTGIINDSRYCGIAYYNAALAFIGYECGVGDYTDFILSPPVGTKYIATSALGTPVVTKIDYSTKAKAGIIFIDSNVSIAGNGSFSKPYQTISEAINKSYGDTTFILKEGDYGEIMDFASLPSGKHTFRTLQGARVRILGSKKITRWTKTAGYTNIYEAVFTDTAPAWTRYKRPIFEDGNPSKPIIDSEKHPLQKGLSYRLPFTILEERVSLADLDSNIGVFYETGKIYIHASNESNPETNGFSYEFCNKAANSNPTLNTAKQIDLTFENIQWFFNTSGLALTGYNKVTRYNCSSLGTKGAGAFRDDVGHIITYNDEAAASDVDGLNGHFASYANYQALTDNRSMSPMAIYYDPWSHDNLDDGISHHENHRVIIYGGLSEYNGDGGIRGSNDSGYTVYNFMSRKNGWMPEGVSGGEGFSVVNATINTQRNGCKMNLFNCISEANQRGFSSISDTKNRIELNNCVSRNNFLAELFCSSGTVISRNTLTSNSNSAKLKVTSRTGVITVNNDNLLV